MVKKLNHDAITIKKLLSKGYTQARICRMLGLKKQKVSYWANTQIKYEIKRKTKLDEKFKKRIIELAEDKLTSDMGSRKIAEIINRELKDNNVRDSKGNVVRDADGKMVKKQNIVHYSCQYLETSQVKRGELIVQNSYYNARNGNLMFRGEETSVVYDFINRYATIRGDIKALPPELRPNLRNVPIQYPTTSEMIAQLCKTLENALPEMLAQPEEYIFNNY